MDSSEIATCLSVDPVARGIFQGVFPANELPHVVRKPCVIVANTDPNTRPGTHWVGFYFDKWGNGEYFCSYASRPYNRWHESFIKRNCTQWKHNSKSLQAMDSDVCGIYCIMYACHRARGKSMSSFINLFSSSDHVWNDQLVSKLFLSHFSKLSMVRQSTTRPSQVCTRRCRASAASTL